MLAALKRLKASGVFSLGMLTVKWNIPKVDRSIHFLLSRTTKQNLSYGEGDNSITLFLYFISITIKLSGMGYSFMRILCHSTLDVKGIAGMICLGKYAA